MKTQNNYLLLITCIIFSACSVSKKIDRQAKQTLINKAAVQPAQVGISIFDPSTHTYLYNYQGDKFFIPASNTKLLTCYAAMKYLGDSLPGLAVADTKDTLFIYPTGDPSLLSPDFKNQPVIKFLQSQTKPIVYAKANWQDNAFGAGWSWDDYESDYSAERSALPAYGNLVTVTANTLAVVPSRFSADFSNVAADAASTVGKVKRSRFANEFEIQNALKMKAAIGVPFITGDSLSALLLADTIHRPIYFNNAGASKPVAANYIIHSQPTDSLLAIMMHRSDNFFAEQSLLMISNVKLGLMNDEKIIDTLLKTDFKQLPQQPAWMDGSGLSRYNLISPQDFVFILDKMRNEFAWNRLTTILPTGGTGTLSSRFKKYAGKIFAKTGTLSNNLALSGYLVTNKGKTLIFSVLVGNHTSSGTEIRNYVEAFLTGIIEKY